jgi:hypothetical protein
MPLSYRNFVAMETPLRRGFFFLFDAGTDASTGAMVQQHQQRSKWICAERPKRIP